METNSKGAFVYSVSRCPRIIGCHSNMAASFPGSFRKVDITYEGMPVGGQPVARSTRNGVLMWQIDSQYSYRRLEVIVGE